LNGSAAFIAKGSIVIKKSPAQVQSTSPAIDGRGEGSISGAVAEALRGHIVRNDDQNGSAVLNRIAQAQTVLSELDAVGQSRGDVEDVGGPALEELARLAPEPVDPAVLKRLSTWRSSTPVALGECAAAFGLELLDHPGHLRLLEEVDFPCLLMLANGNAVALTGKVGRKLFRALGPQGEVEISATRLLAESAETLFRVRTLRPVPRADDDSQEQPSVSVLGEAFQFVVRHHPALMAQLLLCALIGNVLMMAMPVFSMAVYDRVLPHFAFDTLWALGTGIALALATDLALRFVRLKLSDAITAAASSHMQARFFQKLLKIRPDHAPRRVGSLTPALRELDGVCYLLPTALVSLAVDVPFVVLVIFALGTFSSVIAWVALVSVLMMVGIHMLAHLFSERKALPAQDLLRCQTNLLVEVVEALPTIKSLGLERRLLGRWETNADTMAYAAHEARLLHAFTGQIGLIVSQAVIVGVMIAAVHEISISAMTVGALSAATLLINRVMGPLSQIATSVFKLMHSGIALEPVKRVLAAPEERAGDESHASDRITDSTIEFINVRFAPDGARAPVLNSISFTIAPGERVGIIGRIGAGKSSILKLMTRLHEPSGGLVMLGGVDTRQMSPGALRTEIGLMAQDSVLFDDTIHANLALAQSMIDHVAFENACRVSGVQEFIARKVEGYSTRVGPRGEFLSGGERQAISLARTLIADPQVLLLDEPTANMDTALEAKVVQGLKSWVGPRTVIVATHRIGVLDLVDRVIWLDQGQVIADGPKVEILAKISGQNSR
jgi:ATP-binding cassette subfamily C protein LapB